MLRKAVERDINSNCKDWRFQKREAVKATLLYINCIWLRRSDGNDEFDDDI